MSHVQYVTAAHICYAEHSLVVFYAFESSSLKLGPHKPLIVPSMTLMKSYHKVCISVQVSIAQYQSMAGNAKLKGSIGTLGTV